MPSLNDPIRVPNGRTIALLVVLVVVATGFVLHRRSSGSDGLVQARVASPVSTSPGGPATTGGIAVELPTAELQAQFERVLVKLGNMTWAVDDPLGGRIAETQVACNRLDRTVPLLKAVAEQCAPTIELPKLLPLMESRCSTSQGGSVAKCLRFWTRVTAAYKAMIKATTDFSDHVETIPDPACRAALLSHPQPAPMTYIIVEHDALHVRVALRRHDASLLGSSLEAWERHERDLAIYSTREFQAYIDRFRASCHLAHTKDPVAPASGAGSATA